MVLIDSRTGSKELLPLFPKGSAKLATLAFGDFSFIGNGPGGMPYNIGIERKQVREIAGTMMDGRLVGHQLPGLLASYQVVYLVVEGRWRGGPSGLLEQKRGREWRMVEVGTRHFMATDLIKFLNTLVIMAGVKVIKTEDQAGTVREVMGLESWWRKKWEDHSSHFALPPQEVVPFSKASLQQSIAACLPGVGWKRSLAADLHFQSIEEMMGASVGEWMEVEGVGKDTASKIVSAMKWRRR